MAAAAVVCPLGKDVPVKIARGRSSGLARSMATLIVFEISTWPRTTVVTKSGIEGFRQRQRP